MSILFTEPGAGDARLAAALARSGRVSLPVAPAVADIGHGMQASCRCRPSRPAPPPSACVDVELDADALARRTFRHAGLGSARWPALAVAVAEAARQASPARRAHHRALGGCATARCCCPTPGKATPRRFLPYIDVLQGPSLDAQLAGKAVFVGAVAASLDAGVATPTPPTGTRCPPSNSTPAPTRPW